MSTETQGTLIEPNFEEVQDQVGEGIYKCRVVSAEPGKWTGKDGKKDTPFIKWTLDTFGEAEDKNNGRKVFHRTATAGPGAFRLQQFYKAAMGEDLAGSFDYTMLYGRELEITMGPQKDKPEYMEVKATRPISH